MILLESFTEDDFDRLINWISSEEEMIQFSGPIFQYPITTEQLNKYLSADNRLVFRVKDSFSGAIIGHAELNNIDAVNKSARICRILIGAKTNRNKGYGKQIINSLIEKAFNELDLHRLDLGVFDFNKQAVKCYESCGFEIEGLLRDVSKVGNEYWSVYNMSILNNKN